MEEAEYSVISFQKQAILDVDRLAQRSTGFGGGFYRFAALPSASIIALTARGCTPSRVW